MPDSIRDVVMTKRVDRKLLPKRVTVDAGLLDQDVESFAEIINDSSIGVAPDVVIYLLLVQNCQRAARVGFAMSFMGS